MNVENVLKEQKLKYVTQGADFLIKCINPEHSDTHPSMRVDRVSGVFHCFSCGHKGNIFKHFGIKHSEVQVRSSQLKRKIENLLHNVKLDFPRDSKPVTKEYRNISSFTLEAYKAFTTSMIDDMEDRIVFPLYNLKGDIKAFIGRYMYSNASPKYRIYPRKAEVPLFPSNPYVFKDSIILVEGIFDALNLIDKGLPNAVCTFGTDTISEKTSNKLIHLKVLGVTKIFIMFDGDEAGKTASNKLKIFLNKKGFVAETLDLEEGQDPGDLTKEDVDIIRDHLYENSVN